jgi:hypothetical protein
MMLPAVQDRRARSVPVDNPDRIRRRLGFSPKRSCGRRLPHSSHFIVGNIFPTQDRTIK